MEITTKSGFHCSIDWESLQDDYELFKSIAAFQKGDKLAAMDVVSNLLGSEEERLMEHCRGENGRVSITAVTEELTEIFLEVGKVAGAKNS